MHPLAIAHVPDPSKPGTTNDVWIMSASRKISVAGAAIEEVFTLDVTTGTVPREKYEAFVTSAHTADDAFRASTRVKPPAP